MVHTEQSIMVSFLYKPQTRKESESSVLVYVSIAISAAHCAAGKAARSAQAVLMQLRLEPELELSFACLSGFNMNSNHGSDDLGQAIQWLKLPNEADLAQIQTALQVSVTH